MPRRISPPTYRKRTIRGRDVAVVTLTDTGTKRRRDIWLGEYGSDSSRELYSRLLAAWESSGRCLSPARERAAPSGPGELTVTQLCHAFWTANGSRYSRGEQRSITNALRVLRQHYGGTPALRIGPNALRLLREAMITGSADETRRPWSRGYINEQMQRLRQVFKWAVSRELLPVAVYQALKTLEPLKRGRSEAREPEPVRPVEPARIEAVRPYVSRQVAAMIDLQLLTGMRPGEVCAMRPCDLDMSGRVWLYQPEEHKTAHHGKARTSYLGPKAQEILRPFLRDRPTTAYLFSPRDAEAQRRVDQHARRKTPLSYGNRPGTNRREQPRVSAGDCYTTDSYRRAIARACDAVWPPPTHLRRRCPESHARWKTRLGPALWAEVCRWRRTRPGQRLPEHLRKGTWESRKAHRERLGPDRWAELQAWHKAHRWHPHQLRHNYATNVRREYGLEAAQILLGHSSAVITDAVYAERDMAKAQEIAARIG